MTAPRWETVNEDARECKGCWDIAFVDAAGLCDLCAEEGEHPPAPILRLMDFEGEESF